MTRLLRRENLAEGKIALYLERPEGFRFVPGHNIDVGFINQRDIDPSDTSRTFSIASAPYEKELMIAALIRSNSYKKALNSLPIGESLLIDGPYGTFRLHPDVKRPAVFLIGGIGITPVLSMLRQAAREKLDYPIYLFYSNRRREDAVFFDELADFKNDFSHFVFVPTFTRQQESSMAWSGETGRISADMIRRYITDLSGPQYYVVGPSSMVWGTLQVLNEIVDRASIKVEDFTGFD